MKIDLNRPVLDLYGKPVKRDTGERVPLLDAGGAPVTDGKGAAVMVAERVDATLADLALDALMAVPQGTRPDGRASLERFDIALKIGRAAEAGTPVDLSAAEVVTILEQSGAIYTPLAHGRLSQTLDPRPEAVNDPKPAAVEAAGPAAA